jgi:hypothetical protein
LQDFFFEDVLVGIVELITKSYLFLACSCHSLCGDTKKFRRNYTEEKDNNMTKCDLKSFLERED